ncbi:family 1 glycosylhydrolase, partial [Streptococcus pyogenes]
LLAHGLGVQALRAGGADRVGVTLNLTVADPVDPASEADRVAARRLDDQFNGVFLEPVFLGRYPATLLEDVRGLGLEAVVKDGDLAVVAQPI